MRYNNRNAKGGNVIPLDVAIELAARDCRHAMTEPLMNILDEMLPCNE